MPRVSGKPKALLAWSSGKDSAWSLRSQEHTSELQSPFHIWGGAFAAEDVQLVANPGYNSARGPVWVLSLRGHLEF